ncbi:MAG: acetylglutamate kinase [Eggerthellaceae bacterium]|nr:acetylglutamate kinase [Eggerthellaceae bacterium]
MRYARDSRPEGVPDATGEVLAEVLPWIKNITGKTIVIKYGGSAMEDPELRAAVMADILLLKIIGINPVLVHGGGKAVSAAMGRFDLPVHFKDGLRVTDDDTMEVVRMVLTGQVNQTLVEAMNQHGNMAVGISGTDGGIIVADQVSPELGRVGRITRINSALIDDLVKADYIPVIASVAIGEKDGCFNVNADMAAGHIAAAVKASKVIFLTDVDGLYEDYPNEDTLISNMSVDEARQMVDEGRLTSGMIPKITSCITALDAGVKRAHIINGTTPHALLLELMTDKGIGTMVHPPLEVEAEVDESVSHFATKLRENRPIASTYLARKKRILSLTRPEQKRPK